MSAVDRVTGNYRACIAVIFFFAVPAWGTTLSGRVTNGTTGQPAAGDEVILIKLAAGMEEVGRVKTDGQGRFNFTFEAGSAPHLVRVMHQEVSYHKPAPPGTNSVDIEVYDVGARIEGIRAVADLMSIEAAQGKLAITRIFAVDNHSKPPRTQMNDGNFEFYLPDGADIDQAEAQSPGGQAVKIVPRPQAEKARYAFVFPLRPGQTQFRVSYHLPYSGTATIDPRLIYPLEHFVVLLPRSISFAPARGGIYQSKQPPDQPDTVAELVSDAQPGQTLAFDISGDGLLRGQDEEARGTGAPPDTRPGGGLGAPIEAPDPLDHYRGYLLAGLAIVLAAGAVYTVNRSHSARPALAEGSTASGGVLSALKEELFALELEHKQGQISDQEYARAKAALDETLARALRRRR
ncbi:MAG: carboxypeptidase regulatory-like domain-containing protein [Acidobacteria bacterium]|nr:carboxypeptidase regulatory-like domain-containing protein [Acidobacteriota bacterium]MBV9624451.1 carboxypeptidase regulatory-like domain-containing protein [Acidobacteriota bacterium]